MAKHKLTNVRVRLPKTREVVACTLFLDIDWGFLGELLAEAAIHNKSRVTKLAHGSIKAEVRIDA